MMSGAASAAVLSTYAGALGGDDATARAAFQAAAGALTFDDLNAGVAIDTDLPANTDNANGVTGNLSVFYTTVGGGDNASIDIDGTLADNQLGCEQTVSAMMRSPFWN